MVEQFLNEFKNVFAKCAEWTAQLIDAVGGGGVVLAAFCIVLAISLLFIPLRGSGLVVGFDSFNDFTKSVTYKGKYSNGKFVKGNKNYKGKYERRSQGGNNVSPRR